MISEWAAGIRLFSASIHICMTGTIAFWYAFELFRAPSMYFLKYVALLAMMILHGTFNASTAWGDNVTYVIAAFIDLQFLVWFLVTVFWLEPRYQMSRERAPTVQDDQSSQAIEIQSFS